jgi:hypothetical protein
MAQTIQTISAGFDSTGTCVIQVHNSAEVVSFRFQPTTEIGPDPNRSNPQVVLVLVLDDPPDLPGFHVRTFMLVPDGAILPLKYIAHKGTFPMGPGKALTHVVEVSS